MKTYHHLPVTLLLTLLALLLGLAPARAATLPNAWRITDNSAASGVLFYTNTLTAAQKVAATNNGWQFTVVSRLVAGSGNTNPAQLMLYGNGARRFYATWDTNASGQLIAVLGASPAFTNVLASGADVTNYHRHELVYDPATANGTYLFDGTPVRTWPGEVQAAQNGQAVWGANNSAGKGTMNYHQVQFAIGGLGTVTEYHAGFQGSPAIAPSPTNQGWTLVTNTAPSVTLTNFPVSPDGVALPPGFTNVLPFGSFPGVEYGSVAWGDYDNDGRLDFLFTGSKDATRYSQLQRNTGSGFTLVSIPGLPAVGESSVAWGDYDNDGRLDFLLTGTTNGVASGGNSQLWRNTVSGFSNVTSQVASNLPGVGSSSVAWSDYDNDGRLDFLLTGLGTNSTRVSQLWRNTGGVFTNVPIPGLPTVTRSSVAWGDYDNDGRLDFLLTGLTNLATANAISQLWRNTGSGFTNVPIPGLPAVYSCSVAWGDFDNDGRLDFFLMGRADAGGGSYIPSSQLWRNTGGGFTNVPIPGLPGVGDGSVAWGDYDNDGRLDFLLTGWSGSGIPSQLWRNTGSGFANVPIPASSGVFGGSWAWGDYDNDGRLDFLLAGDSYLVWRNTFSPSNSPPSAPTGLATQTNSVNSVTLSWNAALDAQTPTNGLTYNLVLGTSANAVNLASPHADVANGFRRVVRLGAVNDGTNATLAHTFTNLPPAAQYFWSVQAIDTAFAGGPFAPAQSFTACSPNITVVNTNDSGPGSLRQALLELCRGGTIDFDPPLNGRTIGLTSGELVIAKNLTILGPGATNLAISGNTNSRVFSINSGVTCTLAGLTITNGNGVGAFLSGSGGGILNRGTLTVSNSTLTGNSASLDGGGIFNDFTGTVMVQNSTLSGNSASFFGGGIFINGGTLTLQNSTLSGNSARLDGGGIFNIAGTVTVQNSTLSGNRGGTGGGGGLYAGSIERLTNCIVAGNFIGATPNDIGGLNPVETAAYNLIGNAGSAGGITHGANGNIVGNAGAGTLAITSILDTNLAFNGGPTRTHALVSGSPALNAGTNLASLPAFDQRGSNFLRVAFARVDIGAFEVQPTAPVLAGCPANVVTNVANGTDTRAVTWVAPTATGNPTPVVACAPLSGSLFSVGSTLVTCTATNIAGTNLCTFTVTVCATNIVVASAANSGAGSLRTAISNACPGGTITFDPLLNGQTIVLTNGELVIGKNLTLLGPGATNLAISGNGSSRVFYIDSSVTCTLAGLTITKGNGVGGSFSGLGGGIFNRGSLTVSNCALSGNSAQNNGGGIYNGGTLTVQNSTPSGNSAINGGGIYNSGGGTLTVQNSTLSGNSATNGGGIFNNASTLTVQNSTLTGNLATSLAGGLHASGAERLTNCIAAGNFSGTTPSDIGGLGGYTVDSAAYNLIGSTNGVVGITHGVNGNSVGNAGSGTLAITSILNTNLLFNGGPTRTHALAAGSLALNAGTNVASLPAFDQRGSNFLRIVAGTVDIGAYEVQSTAPAITCPADLVVSNTPGQCSALVAFAVLTNGLPAPVVICRLTNTVITSPRSFTVGTNVVTCTATNIAGTNVCSFNVIVRDAEPPVIVCPAADPVFATPPGSNSTLVTFTVTATDNCDANVAVVCVPASGGYFPVGTNAVACTATDDAGNTNVCAFAVRVSPPEFSLVDSGLPPVSFGTIAWGDYDNDGLLDLVLSGSSTNNVFVTQIWRNTGSGFSNLNAGLPGLNVSTAAWGDYDNDGRLDLVIAGNTNLTRLTQIWRNTGSGFVNLNAGLTGVDDASLAWGDFDNDGRLDLLLTGFTGSARVAQIWRNTGSSFSNINAGLTGLSTGGAAWGDFDNDGRLDLILTGLDGGSVRRTELWRNTGAGFVKETTPFPGVSASAVAWGDFDNDGWLDLALTGNLGGGAIAQVWRNTGGSFSNVNAALPGVSESSVAWGDYDNDGRPDLLLTGTGGSPSGPLAQIWRNTGTNFVLTPSGLAPVRIGRGAWGDFNNDGRLDAALVGLGDGGVRVAQVWRNNFAGATNNVPATPAGLSATVNSPQVQLRWNASADVQTPAPGLSYNLALGTSAGAINVLSPQANLTGGFRRLPALGNAQLGTNATLELPPGTYFWAVQAVDGAWAGGPFASGGSFVVTTPVRITAYERRSASAFWLEFTGATATAYRVEWSANLTSWNNLGLASVVSPGRYEFTDNAATPLRRFYRVTFP